MIGEVVRGSSMPDLISYLFGPGRCNEHVNQHLVAGYADAVYSAPDRLWEQEPGVTRNVRNEARSLGWELDFPRSRWGTEIAAGHVWHCSLSLRHDEGPLTDEQWSEAAHEIIKTLGFDGSDGKAPCRWVAVRHGLSTAGNDHIHLAVDLVREDGTKASTWNDYRKVGRACSALEDRFGLSHVEGRMTGRSLPEPSRADREISAARGDPEPLRIGLERKVRACAAIATSEDHFTRLAAERGLLVRPRYSPDGMSITGYAFADQTARRSPKGPVWFGGGKLAPDLTVTHLRRRWQSPSRTAADLTAVAAVATETDRPGTLSAAARHLARAAAQDSTTATAVVTTMADTFLAGIASPGMQLFYELDALITACLTTATTTTARTSIRQARALVHVTAADLAAAAEAQARTTLEDTMTDLTHEHELIDHLTRAAAIGANIVRTIHAASTPANPGLARQADALRKAGYIEVTPFDGKLRELFGERRWAMYATDPARIVAAAAITDAARAGYDVPALLARAVDRRAWEDDRISAARSIAGVLAYRIEKELTARGPRRPSVPVQDFSSDITTSPIPSTPALVTLYDAQLEKLLGARRWQQYAEDPRRSDVAGLITQAAAEGRDVNRLLTEVVTSRDLETARRVAGVLHYRLEKALQLSPETAECLEHATAPAGNEPKTMPATTARDGRVHPPRTTARNSNERDAR
jgi:hypothetical protein